MTDKFENSFQVLKGFKIDISVKVNENKVIINIHFYLFCFALHVNPRRIDNRKTCFFS